MESVLDGDVGADPAPSSCPKYGCQEVDALRKIWPADGVLKIRKIRKLQYLFEFPAARKLNFPPRKSQLVLAQIALNDFRPIEGRAEGGAKST